MASSQSNAGTGIHIQELSKTYNPDSDEPVTALEGIDFTIGDQEFISVVGPSGCGKSTLLRLIGGLTQPTAGRVYINGENVTGPISDIGIVFQSATLLPWRTIHGNVMFPCEALKSRNKLQNEMEYYDQQASDLLDLVGLGDFTEAYPKELSGGMQQRAAICRALVTDPSILLMDEPFGALDEFTRDRLNTELLEIFRQTNKTIVFITHDIHEAVYLSDRVLVLTDRPAKIKTVVDIDIERPRSEEVRDSKRFLDHVSTVRDEIKAYI